MFNIRISAVHGGKGVLAVDGRFGVVGIHNVAFIEKFAAFGDFFKGEQFKQIFELNTRPHSVTNKLIYIN